MPARLALCAYRVATVIVIVVVGYASPQAAPVTVTASGHVTTVGPSLSAFGFAVGHHLSMTYVIDPAVPDAAPLNPDIGYYVFPPTGWISIGLGGYTMTTNQLAVQILANFDIWSLGTGPVNSNTPAPLSVQSFNWTVQGPTFSSVGGNLGGSDAVLVAPDLSLPWSSNNFTILFNGPIQSFIWGTITSASISTGPPPARPPLPPPPVTVPEPSALLSLAPGVLALVLRRRTRSTLGR